MVRRDRDFISAPLVAPHRLFAHCNTADQTRARRGSHDMRVETATYVGIGIGVALGVLAYMTTA
jgi:hypothetical protein